MAHRAGYTLHEQLHASHRSTLFRATRIRDQCPVILKLTSSDYLDRRRTLELRREYAIARRVEGDGIVRVLGLEEFPDRAALVLEDFGGSSLRHLLDERGPLEVSTFLDFAVRISAALGHIHHQGVIHKDIKPHNIVVNPDTGVVKITDFSTLGRPRDRARLPPGARPTRSDGHAGLHGARADRAHEPGRRLPARTSTPWA